MRERIESSLEFKALSVYLPASGDAINPESGICKYEGQEIEINPYHNSAHPFFQI